MDTLTIADIKPVTFHLQDNYSSYKNIDWSSFTVVTLVVSVIRSPSAWPGLLHPLLNFYSKGH